MPSAPLPAHAPATRHQPARRCIVSPRTRFLDFPWGSKVGWPLREIGVNITGMDYLSGPYLAGTEASLSHLLYFVLKGEVEYDVGKGFSALPAGSWIVCPAGSPHWIRLRKGRAEALWVHLFDVPRWEFLKSDERGPFAIGEAQQLLGALVHAIEEAGGGALGSHECAVAQATIFRVYLLRELDRIFGQWKEPLLARFTALWAKVSQELNEEWEVGRLARELHMSRSSLYENTERLYSLSPMGMVTRLRMERARDRLLHADDTLEQIAATVGYKNPYAFSQAFLREIGQRPGEYRRVNR